jgi:hypothetical protein
VQYFYLLSFSAHARLFSSIHISESDKSLTSGSIIQLPAASADAFNHMFVLVGFAKHKRGAGSTKNKSIAAYVLGGKTFAILVKVRGRCAGAYRCC